MLGTIKLNTIKNKLNDFELKACVYISDSVSKDNIKQSFSPHYYVNNKASFYIVCSNKRPSSYWIGGNSIYHNHRNAGRNRLLDACAFGKNHLLQIHSIDLEKFLIIRKNNDFLGWYASDNLIDENIECIRGNKHCKHYKDNIYYGDNIYSVDTDKLYLFVRIIPKNYNNLTNLIINCERDYIYNISERTNEDKVGTLGFIVKLDDRSEYVYSKTYSKITRIKYPFLTKRRIDNVLFGGFEADYIIKREILYIKDSSKLDAYKINVLDNF